MPSTRRAFLGSVAAGGVALAGCSEVPGGGTPDPDDPPPSGVDDLPAPDRHVFGANGEWSSFGCNASNNREVADGEAPVDGVSERWRVEVPQTTQREPVVAGDRVYQPGWEGLSVLDAASGEELYAIPEVETTPLVWDDVAYVSDGDAIRALDAETGEPVWERPFDTPGQVTTPATYGGQDLYVGAGEQVVGLDPASGEVLWRRDVFGRVVDSLAVFNGFYVVAATTAGLVYLLDGDGGGHWRWRLPSPPVAAPSADTDSVYVSCRNGRLYALGDDSELGADPLWTKNTGWAERGIAVVDGLVMVANGTDVHAIDAESGSQQWTYGMGDWRHTAPAYARDTVFVGGDRLHALDPTPGDDPSNGPAVRFEREFFGRVGPGPVLDDGTVYVVAQTGEEAYHLLALE